MDTTGKAARITFATGRAGCGGRGWPGAGVAIPSSDAGQHRGRSVRLLDRPGRLGPARPCALWRLFGSDDPDRESGLLASGSRPQHAGGMAGAAGRPDWGTLRGAQS